MKRCPRCDRDLPVDEFSRNRSSRDGLQTWCRSCFREERARRREQDSAAGVDRQRRRLYGLEPEEFDRMVAEQEGRCAVCGREPSGDRWDRSLHVDHDHETGAIRGLLCGPCNRGIGLLGDSADRIAAALAYLIVTSEPTQERQHR